MQLVDWRVAEAIGQRVVPPGPKLGIVEASSVVSNLRDLAQQAAEHVEAYTGLDTGESSATIAVVDRPEWVRGNIDGFQRLAEPLLQRVLDQNTGPSKAVTAVGSKVAGAEVGVLLGYLATRVLGQFELLGPPPGESSQGVGRLSLVAPNIVVAERALGVDPGDFRLWVCLHEVTHRTQFAAAPWLHGYVQHLLGDYLGSADLEPAALVARLRLVLTGVVKVIAGRSDASIVELLQNAGQREILDRITGLMSLLEGHADVVMDGVGPEVIGSVDAIRRRFERRRHDSNPADRAFRRLIGLEAKLKQYAEGATFVRHVLDVAGMAGLNRVWAEATTLPTGVEIRNPDAWLRRMGLAPAVSA